MRTFPANRVRTLGLTLGLLCLIVLPGLSGCGCSDDTPLPPTSTRGGGGSRCEICVAMRVLASDFLVYSTASAPAPGGSSQSNGGPPPPPTLDLKLCFVDADASLGDVQTTPCVTGLEVGDVAEWGIRVERPHEPNSVACFNVCECASERVIESFCVRFFDAECAEWEVLPGNPLVTGINGFSRVVPCDEMPELCCFCLNVQCTDGFEFFGPDGASGQALVAGDASTESPPLPALKEICLLIDQFDQRIADHTMGYAPIIKPCCQYVSPFGGIAQYEVCVLDVPDDQGEFMLSASFVGGGNEQVGIAMLGFGDLTSCEPVLIESSPNVSIDLTCTPPVQVCCVPMTICVTPSLDVTEPTGGTVWAKVQGNGVTPQVFPALDENTGVYIPGFGGAVTFWVCVPENHGNAVVTFDVCSDFDWLLSGIKPPYPIGQATLAYDAARPCDPGMTVEFGQIVKSTTIQCLDDD
jgi:hypothetical protein